MKLRNKKTGDIGELQITEKHCGVVVGNGSGSCGIEIYSSLTELNDDWEDCEYSKDFYYIQPDGLIHWVQCKISAYELKKFQEIGNFFETREQAEKAVEKLKAWKRLKDKGFRFIGVRGIGKVIDFDIPEPYNHIGFDEYEVNNDEKEFYDDLLLLFGGDQ